MFVLFTRVFILTHDLNLIRINFIFLINKSWIVQKPKITILMKLRISYEKLSLSRAHYRTLKKYKTSWIVYLIDLESFYSPDFESKSSRHFSSFENSSRILPLTDRSDRPMSSMSSMGSRLSSHVIIRNS
jgi:hypothetical protein